MKQIAIDGPAGAGKSTIAKEISKKLGFVYIDTGAMYRTIALACIKKNADQSDEKAVTEIAENAVIDIKYTDGVQHMLLDGEDVSTLIRTEQVSKAASDTSKFAGVRTRLVEMQRALAEKYDVVMDGRDIGTVVLPNAALKIFLTASVDVRAQRRHKEYAEKGIDCDIEVLKKEIAQRDYNDSTRANSPLKKADDAVEIDSSELDIEEVTEKIVNLIK